MQFSVLQLNCVRPSIYNEERAIGYICYRPSTACEPQPHNPADRLEAFGRSGRLSVDSYHSQMLKFDSSEGVSS